MRQRPSFISVESGFFEVKLIPHISAPHTLNTEFEFWFSGEQRITNINNIEQEAEFLGRAKVWSKGQLKPDMITGFISEVLMSMVNLILLKKKVSPITMRMKYSM